MQNHNGRSNLITSRPHDIPVFFNFCKILALWNKTFPLNDSIYDKNLAEERSPKQDTTSTTYLINAIHLHKESDAPIYDLSFSVKKNSMTISVAG